jgi:exonuclease VII small subunit
MGEYQKWAQTANELGFEMVKVEIEEAIEKLSQCNRHLEQALKKL